MDAIVVVRLILPRLRVGQSFVCFVACAAIEVARNVSNYVLREKELSLRARATRSPEVISWGFTIRPILDYVNKLPCIGDPPQNGCRGSQGFLRKECFYP